MPAFRSQTCVIPLLLSLSLSYAAEKRSVTLDDLYRLHDVSSPEVSPDGQWIAYTLSTTDKDGDKRDSDLWMVSWDGKQRIQLTFSPESEGSPRWSPDGKYLSFTSSRPGKAKGSQIWFMDRRGGEARQVTDFKQKISSYEWSPDSKRLVLVLRESDEPEADTKTPATPPKPKPIVVDRYHFKQDMEGYLSGTAHPHLFLYDIESKKLDVLPRKFPSGSLRDRWDVVDWGFPILRPARQVFDNCILYFSVGLQGKCALTPRTFSSGCPFRNPHLPEGLLDRFVFHPKIA